MTPGLGMRIAQAVAPGPGGRPWLGLERDLVGVGFLVARPAPSTVDAAELDALPPPVRAWMGFFGVEAGQRKRESFRASWTGHFRLAPTRPWMSIEAAQLTMARPIRRWFRMHARLAGLLPMVSEDSYVGGRGRIEARLAALVTVADVRGPEVDCSELVTWVNDCVLFAPSMLLAAGAAFHAIDDRNFTVSVTEGGQSVTARVRIDDRGAPLDFETDDRYLADPDDRHHRLVRRRWRTPIDGWGSSGGLVYPLGGKAVWELWGRPYVYADFRLVPEGLAYDPVLEVPLIDAGAAAAKPSTLRTTSSHGDDRGIG